MTPFSVSTGNDRNKQNGPILPAALGFRIAGLCQIKELMPGECGASGRYHRAECQTSWTRSLLVLRVVGFDGVVDVFFEFESEAFDEQVGALEVAFEAGAGCLDLRVKRREICFLGG